MELTVAILLLFGGTPGFLQSCLALSSPRLLGVAVGTLQGIAVVVLLVCGVFPAFSKIRVSRLGWIVPICVGVGLIALGVIGFHSRPSDSVWHSVAEAVFVAGLLITVVDPFMKWRLLKEVSVGLFPYLIGFELPHEIQARLGEIVHETKLYRPSMKMRLAFSRPAETVQASGGKVEVRFETEFEVVNPTVHDISYKYSLEFEEAEHTRDVNITLPGEEQKPYAPQEYLYGVHVCDFTPVILEKRSARENGKLTEYNFQANYVQTYPVPGFHLQTFVLPTMVFTLELKEAPDNLEVITTIPEGVEYLRDSESGSLKAGGKDHYETLRENVPITYKSVLMKGDSINIRWRAKASTNQANAAETPSPAAGGDRTA